MKYIITEEQLEKAKDKILRIPFDALDNDWEVLQKYLERRNFPPYVLIGDVDLSKEKNLSLGSLTIVEGNLKLPYSFEFNTFEKLIEIKGDLTLSYTLIDSLGSLRKVGGNLILSNTSIQSLGDLEYVGGSLLLKWCQELQSLGNLLEVEDDLYMQDSGVVSFGKLEYVGGDMKLYGTPGVRGLDYDAKYDFEISLRKKITIGGNVVF